MVQVIRWLDADFIPELQPHFISKWRQSRSHMLIPFKVLNSLSKYQYESRADDVLLYDLHQGRTVFLHPSSELTRVPQPHKLDSLCRTEWGYCSAVASHGFSLPTFPGVFECSAEICSLKQTHILQSMNTKDRFGESWGVQPKVTGREKLSTDIKFQFQWSL